MNPKINDGGPVFPNLELGKIHFDDPGAYPGISIRDYFAGKALEGMLSDPNCVPRDRYIFAKECYQWADGMIKARAETTTS